MMLKPSLASVKSHSSIWSAIMPGVSARASTQTPDTT